MNPLRAPNAFGTPTNLRTPKFTSSRILVMDWVKCSPELYTGGKSVPVRSLRFQDEIGQWRRYRVCTIWNLEKLAFTRRPAKAKLVKDKQGSVGVVVSGSGSGFVKVGRSKAVQHTITTSLGAISKKARRVLLRQIDGEVSEHDGVMVVWER